LKSSAGSAMLTTNLPNTRMSALANSPTRVVAKPSSAARKIGPVMARTSSMQCLRSGDEGLLRARPC
jgi:hypothetical protein